MADNDKSLLDMMLDDSKPPATTPEPRRAAPEPEPDDEPAPVEPWPTDVEQLKDLTGAELRAFLAEVSPGDLVCVVGEGSEALRQRVMGQLNDESVTWLKGNLELWDRPTVQLREDSRRGALKVARRLVAEGKIAEPETAAGRAAGQDEASVEVRDELTRTLVELVAAAKAQGVDALVEVVGEIEHPLLAFGLQVLLDKPKPALLERRLDERQQALEAAYRAELELIRQALLAIGRGDDPKAFLDRAARR